MLDEKYPLSKKHLDKDAFIPVQLVSTYLSSDKWNVRGIILDNQLLPLIFLHH